MSMQGYVGADLLQTVSDDETTSQAVDCRGRTQIVVYLSSSGTTSSGVITIEESMPVGQPGGFVPGLAPYSGTWSTITTVNASSFTGGVMTAVHLSQAAYAFVRVRVSTAIGGGGTISAGLVAV